MSDIFISYASADRARVKPIVDALQAQGWSVWWDRTILPGKNWDRVIEEALDAARCVIVLWSAVSAGSDWVRTEAEEAKQRGILVPVLLDEVQIPLAFRRIQAASLVGWTGKLPSAAFDDVSAAISAILGAAQAAPPATLASPPVSKSPPGNAGIVRKPVSGRRKMFVAGAALAVCGIAFALLLESPQWQLYRRNEKILSIAQTFRTEFRKVRAESAPSAAQIDQLDRDVEAIHELDPNNGHGLYFSGEMRRVRWAMSHHIAMTELDKEPCKMPDEAEREFNTYLEAAGTAAAPKDRSNKADLCYTRPDGFCPQRTAWVDHLLSNGFYERAGATTDRLVAIDLLRRAIEKGKMANLYVDGDGHTGFSQCRPTKALVDDAEKRVHEMEGR